MNKYSRIYVAGHQGMVGSAIVRNLREKGYQNIVVKSHRELDLLRQKDVEDFFADENIECVFLAAAKVGGVSANMVSLADFFYENMAIEMNVMHSAWINGIDRLEFLSTSCIYPEKCSQPMKEGYLMTGNLEDITEAYGLAKISGMKYCEFLNRQNKTRYFSVIPSNLYGPNDNYHPEYSNVLPALIRRFHEAKEKNSSSVICWGDGTQVREFLYVDDLADLCVFLMENYYEDEPVNAGTGKETSIKELAELIARIIGYNGEILWDTNKPKGIHRKLLDVSKAASIGWVYQTELEDGIRLAYEDFLKKPIRVER